MECDDGLMMVGELGASTDDAGQDEHERACVCVDGGGGERDVCVSLCCDDVYHLQSIFEHQRSIQHSPVV